MALARKWSEKSDTPEKKKSIAVLGGIRLTLVGGKELDRNQIKHRALVSSLIADYVLVFGEFS